MTTPRKGRPYRTATERMWAEWAAAGRGTNCHLCGHPGATEADHVNAIRDNPAQVPHWTAIRPAHGVNPRGGHPGPCSHPDCLALNSGKPRACNQARGAGDRPAPPQPHQHTREW